MDLNIYRSDIDLIKDLNSSTYPLSMKGVVAEPKIRSFKNLQERLKNLSDFFKKKYDDDYGIFVSERATGNAVGRSGKLRRVWSGIYKGTYNKQYSAQVSFVINTEDSCLDVGFYFGRASSQNMDKNERILLEQNLRDLGRLLSQNIQASEELTLSYQKLFDLGFKAFIKGENVNSSRWLQNASIDPTHSSITFSLFPNSSGIINVVDIDACVAASIVLMNGLPQNINVTPKPVVKRLIPPLTPEQRAKQAEMRAMIGFEGEKFIMNIEAETLAGANIQIKGYPSHKALISDSFGYDILSHDGINDIYIEVKTTTRLKNDVYSKTFYMSASEYDFYKKNKLRYKLYRVYDIYGQPHFDEINLGNIKPEINGYRMTFDN